MVTTTPKVIARTDPTRKGVLIVENLVQWAERFNAEHRLPSKKAT